MLQIGMFFVFFLIFGGPRKIYDMNVFLFLSTGIIALFFFQKIAQEMPGAMRRMSGFTRLSIINQSDTLIAGGILEAILMTILAAILWGFIIFAGLGFAPANPVGVIASLVCLAALGFGFGWFNAVFLVFVPVYKYFLNIFYRFILFTSGAIFPLEKMPPQYFHYLKLNPVFQGVDLLRSHWSYTHESTESSSSFILCFAAGFLFLGLLLNASAERVKARNKE
jgi:capsular polysaccharide transport system permease protein